MILIDLDNILVGRYLKDLILFLHTYTTCIKPICRNICFTKENLREKTSEILA